jgi:hypothetical protein
VSAPGDGCHGHVGGRAELGGAEVVALHHRYYSTQTATTRPRPRRRHGARRSSWSVGPRRQRSVEHLTPSSRCVLERARFLGGPDDIEDGYPQDIFVDKTTPTRSWRGWPNFDGLCPVYLFLYGNFLMHLPGNLGYVLVETLIDATLREHSRAWNIVFSDTSHPHLNIVDADGRPFNGLIGGMSVAERPGGECRGAVIRLSSHDLGLLTERHRNFVQKDVTDLVEWEGKPENCLVYTLAPSNAAYQRRQEARAVGSRIYVPEAEYREMTETLRRLRIDLDADAPLPEGFELRDLSITYKPVPYAQDGVVAAQRRMFGQSELF